MSAVIGAVETKVFRVEEFRNPVLTKDRRIQLEAAEANPVDLSVEAILSDAQTQTGLCDFGPMDFVERLLQLANEVAENKNIWRHSKERMRASFVKAAANRLKNKAFLDAHPDVKKQEIEKPIISVGLPRSGPGVNRASLLLR